MAYLLGYDIGSSFIKAALLEAETGRLVAAAAAPETELTISSPRPGWAEQDPEVWWDSVLAATAAIRARAGVDLHEVQAVGVSYQMHGLVLVDREQRPLRPAIIWCDSRAVPLGARAFAAIGEEVCLRRFLNSPGNFTAAKLAWVKENEPGIYAQVHRAMLPGDYIAMRMTGEIKTTPSGLSEGILWDFLAQEPARPILDFFGISPHLLPEIVPTFAPQGRLTREAADRLGLRPGTPVSYRAGDQPNNAFSLNVLAPGELAATAGTSGVVYGVIDRPAYDPLSRVNTFVHVNHSRATQRYGVLLCLNGAGSLNRWLKNAFHGLTYEEMNALAAEAPVGAAGLAVLPYGNGAERTLGNRCPGAIFHGLDFNLHGRAHLLRAAQEGVVFALYRGLQIMEAMGLEIRTVRAGRANMFLSPLFSRAFAAVTGARVELYNTDGAQGAARGAGVGAGIYPDCPSAFGGLKSLQAVEPDPAVAAVYREAYRHWLEVLRSQPGYEEA